jgi:hypothetical protein
LYSKTFALFLLFGVSLLWDPRNPLRFELPTVTSQQEVHGVSGPLVYASPSDRKPRAEPRLPAIGRAGIRIVDPTFGNRILRVTDPFSALRIDRAYRDRRFHTPGSAESIAWNSDSSRFYVEMSGGLTMIYDFDAATMTATLKRSDAGIKLSPSWSWFNRDVLYTMRDDRPLVFTEFNSATGKFKDLHNVASCLPRIAHTQSGDISLAQLDRNSGLEDRMLNYVGGDEQDLHHYIYVYDRQSGCRYLDTSTGEIGGQWGPKGTSTGVSDHFLIHNARISKSGEYALITPVQGADLYVWEISGLKIYRCRGAFPDLCGGHHVWGWNDFVNGDGLSGDIKKNDSATYRRRKGDLTDIVDLIQTALSNPPVFQTEKHLSWADSNERNPYPPVISGIYRVDNQPEQRPWDTEIVGIRTDGTEQVWRFCHHRSWVVYGGSQDFDAMPKPNVSQDGRWALFNSNWEQTLGRDQNGSPRVDVFLVELK